MYAILRRTFLVCHELQSKGIMGKTKKFYAVAKGRNVGIFSSWDECKLQTEGYKGARYKSFLSENEAER